MIHLSQSLIGVVYSPYLVSINAASALTELFPITVLLGSATLPGSQYDTGS
jgi:hypothetical protein